MTKMKDSGIEWIGEIPEVWEVTTLKRLFQGRDGGAWGVEPQNDDNDVVCIRVADFDFDKLSIKKSDEYTIRNYESKTVEKLLLKQGDILIEKSGGGELTPVGRVIEFDLPIKALYANFIDRLRPENFMFSKYVLYLLVSYYFFGISKKYIKQTTGIQNLDLTSFLTIYTILPPLPQQQSIADYLDRKCGLIDGTIERQKAVIEKLKQYKQSVITEAVTKGLNPAAKMKPSGIEWIGDVPEGWEVQPLFVVFKERKCKNIGNNEKNLLSLSYGNIVRKDASNNMGLLPESFDGYNIVEKDNIVFRLTDLQNDHVSLRSSIVSEKGIITSAYVTIEKIIQIYAKFFHYLFRSYDVSKAFYNMGGGVRQGVNFTELKKIPLIIPSITEQQAIADYLDAKCAKIDEAINGKQKLIEKLTDYKKSLIYECVTGKR